MITIQDQSRSEYRGSKPPEYLATMISAIGGINPYGNPMYRLVRAEERMIPSGGVWLDWPKGTAVKDRNSSRNTPYKRSVEIRQIKRYGPMTGWALEKWVPAKAYGTRERWYAPASIGGTVLLIKNDNTIKRVPSQGDYPSRGDYEFAGAVFQNDQLSEATVIHAVQALVRDLESLPTNPLNRIAQRSAIARAAADYADQQYTNWANDVVADKMPAFGMSPAIGYGPKKQRSVNRIARKLGIRSHTGIS